MVFRYLSLFLLYINIKIGKNRCYGKELFTWLSLVVSLMASFVLSFFPLDVLDEICELSQFLRDFFPSLALSSLALSLIFSLSPYRLNFTTIGLTEPTLIFLIL